MRIDKPSPPPPQNEKMIILLPVLKIGKLENFFVEKLADYDARLAKYNLEAHLPENRDWDTIYKAAILKKLLDQGEVKYQDLFEELYGLYGAINKAHFKNAWGVVQLYIENGGIETGVGTGLSRS